MEISKLFRYFVPALFLLYIVWFLLGDILFWINQLAALSLLSVIAWTLAYAFYEWENNETIEPHNQAVLITGCDTGFGNELAQRLDRFGFTVFAGVLFPEGEGAVKLKQNGSSRLHIVPMDVTKKEDVEQAVAAISESKVPLWAVVNNAGVGVFCPFEWGHDVDEYRKLFDVNVFGMVRVTKYCIPLLRKSKGRIINVASLAGRISPSGIGHYCMSKHSVRSFSDVIRRELHREQIEVITLEPTFYRTQIINNEAITESRNRILERTPAEVKASYIGAQSTDEGMKTAASLVYDIARKNVGEVVDAMEKAITLKSPKIFYRCCGYPDLLVWAMSHLPEVILDNLIVGMIYNRFVRAGITAFARLMSKFE